MKFYENLWNSTKSYEIQWFREDSGKIQEGFRDDSGMIQGWFRSDSGMIQGGFRDESGRSDLGMIQGWFRDDSGVIQGWFREDSGMIQGGFRDPFEFLRGVLDAAERKSFGWDHLSPSKRISTIKHRITPPLFDFEPKGFSVMEIFCLTL